MFASDGAVQIIRRANAKDLKTFYPIRRNIQGEYAPMWRSYLFIEFREGVTINLCRTTTHFIKIVSERDEEGLLRPILVKREAVKQSMGMVLEGKYNERAIDRRFYGKGSVVCVLEGNFIGKKVKLEMDISPEMLGTTKVKVDIDGLKGTIELYKLAL